MRSAAVLVILAVFAVGSAHAAEKLDPGTKILYAPSQGGGSATLEEAWWLIDREELNDAIAEKTKNKRLEALVLDYAAIEAARAEDPKSEKILTPCVIGGWSVSVTIAFIGGAYVFSRL